MPIPRFRTPELIPLLFIVAATALLVGLGMWQVERLQWKTALIERAETALMQPPLTALPKGDLAPYEYRRIRLSGAYAYDKTLHVLGRQSEGYYLYTPLTLPNGTTVMVNRGWAPKNQLNVQDESRGTIEGFLRMPREKRMFSPPNQVEKNLWFVDDPQAMSEATGMALAGAIVEATAPENKNGIPIINSSEIRFRNDHLGYAITWFLLAAAGLVMFAAYHRKPRG